jgi:predicted DNA binding CopG/RHH family protein
MPKFMSENEEAAWWESAEGPDFLKQHQATRTATKRTGSPLVTNLSRINSVQIALRLPAPDVAKAREIAGRTGIGYQTLLKMLAHEGLLRGARQQ